MMGVPVLNSAAQVEAWAAFARSAGLLPCAVHIDTGMNRLGLRYEEVEALAASPDGLSGLRVELVLSHLACADQEQHPMNARQEGRFRKARALLSFAPASLANTAERSAGVAVAQPVRALRAEATAWSTSVGVAIA